MEQPLLKTYFFVLTCFKGWGPKFRENPLSLVHKRQPYPLPPLSIFSPDFPEILDANDKTAFEMLGDGGGGVLQMLFKMVRHYNYLVLKQLLWFNSVLKAFSIYHMYFQFQFSQNLVEPPPPPSYLQLTKDSGFSRNFGPHPFGVVQLIVRFSQ